MAAVALFLLHKYINVSLMSLNCGVNVKKLPFSSVVASALQLAQRYSVM